MFNLLYLIKGSVKLENSSFNTYAIGTKNLLLISAAQLIHLTMYNFYTLSAAANWKVTVITLTKNLLLISTTKLTH